MGWTQDVEECDLTIFAYKFLIASKLSQILHSLYNNSCFLNPMNYLSSCQKQILSMQIYMKIGNKCMEIWIGAHIDEMAQIIL